MNQKRDPLQYVIFIFFGVAVILFGIAGYIFKSRKDFEKNAVITQGVVVDLITSGRRSTSLAPVIEYPDRTGKYHLYYHNVFTKPASYDINEKVELFVNPADPLDVQIKGESIVFWILAGIGTVFLGFAIGFFFVFRKEF